MFRIKAAVLAAAATFAFASPSLAQNFQGFGAPSWIMQDEVPAPTQQKLVHLKAKRHVKPAR
ncbi:MAG: hypothetical protein JO000_28535 [Alphaproteobacteria bacterium]|nr:hypothetical protein [Alphaproteobacteria bacterium]